MDSIAFLGHATTLVRLAGASVLTDPLLRGGIGPLRRREGPVDRSALGTPDLILLSHLHRDHLDLPSLRSLPASIPTVVPAGAAELAARGGRSEVVELAPGERVSLAGLEVTATPAAHDGHRDRWGPEVEPLGFVVSDGGRSVYFAGDTDLFEGMAELGPLSAALLPIAGWGPSLGPGHLDPERAARALQDLRPAVAVPIHWGSLHPIGCSRLLRRNLTEPPIEFERFAASLAPEVQVEVLRSGESLSLESLPPARAGEAA